MTDHDRHATQEDLQALQTILSRQIEAGFSHVTNRITQSETTLNKRLDDANDHLRQLNSKTATSQVSIAKHDGMLEMVQQRIAEITKNYHNLNDKFVEKVQTVLHAFRPNGESDGSVVVKRADMRWLVLSFSAGAAALYFVLKAARVIP